MTLLLPIFNAYHRIQCLPHRQLDRAVPVTLRSRWRARGAPAGLSARQAQRAGSRRWAGPSRAKPQGFTSAPLREDQSKRGQLQAKEKTGLKKRNAARADCGSRLHTAPPFPARRHFPSPQRSHAGARPATEGGPSGGAAPSRRPPRGRKARRAPAATNKSAAPRGPPGVVVRFEESGRRRAPLFF